LGSGGPTLNVYLESSAALRDILEGEHADLIRADLRTAEAVVTSRLTLAEVGRRLAQLRALDPETAANVAAREAAFFADAERWGIDPVDDAVWERCARAFPIEPVRALDAIHLATIERISAVLPRLVVLSTDDRVRRNAEALGFTVRP
jgi:predicted nucleic acid-binding protein